MYIHIYPTPSSQAVCGTRSIFKWSLTGLNTGFHTKVRVQFALQFSAYIYLKNKII